MIGRRCTIKINNGACVAACTPSTGQHSPPTKKEREVYSRRAADKDIETDKTVCDKLPLSLVPVTVTVTVSAISICQCQLQTCATLQHLGISSVCYSPLH